MTFFRRKLSTKQGQTKSPKIHISFHHGFHLGIHLGFRCGASHGFPTPMNTQRISIRFLMFSARQTPIRRLYMASEPVGGFTVTSQPNTHCAHRCAPGRPQDRHRTAQRMEAHGLWGWRAQSWPPYARFMSWGRESFPDMILTHLT